MDRRNFLGVAGAVAGSAIDPTTFGLDAAFPAGFVAMVWPLLSDRRARQAAVLGGVICAVAIPLTAIGVPILLSALAVLVGLQRSPRVEPAIEVRP